MKKFKNEKGITLVALIITIVVLLILAVVAIGAVRDSNIIGHAQKAGSDYTIAQEKEQIGLAVSEWQIEKTISVNTPVFKDVITNALQGQIEDEVIDNEDGSITIIFIKTGNHYKVEKNGTITPIDKEEVEPSVPEEPDDPVEKGIVITQTTLTVQKNKTATITVTLKGDLKAEDIVYSSSAEGIAIVTANEDKLTATVTGVDIGSSTITATCGDYTAELSVGVIEWGYIAAYNMLACQGNAVTVTINESQIEALITTVDSNRIPTITDEPVTVDVNTVAIFNFDYCENIETIDFNGKLSGDKSGVSIPVKRVLGLEGVTKISFKDKKILEYVELPSTLLEIGEDCFYNCTNLKQIDIPENVTSIGKDAFNNCTSLTSIGIPNNLTSIGENAFGNCEKITSIDMSASNLKTVGNRAFQDCTSLTEIVLPASLETIGYQTFSACRALTNITINKAEGSLDLTINSGLTDEQIAAVKWNETIS